jgi:hypothetical protein
MKNYRESSTLFLKKEEDEISKKKQRFPKKRNMNSKTDLNPGSESYNDHLLEQFVCRLLST